MSSNVVASMLLVLTCAAPVAATTTAFEGPSEGPDGDAIQALQQVAALFAALADGSVVDASFNETLDQIGTQIPMCYGFRIEGIKALGMSDVEGVEEFLSGEYGLRIRVGAYGSEFSGGEGSENQDHEGSRMGFGYYYAYYNPGLAQCSAS